MIWLVGILILALFLQGYYFSKERKRLIDTIKYLVDTKEGVYETKDNKTMLTLRRNFYKRNMRHAYRTMYGSDKAE